MPLFYGDLYKPVKNVLDAGYSNTTKFTVRTKPNTDLKLEVNAERKNNSAIDASLKWTQTIRNRGILFNVGGKLDAEGTVDINTGAIGVAKGLDLGLDAKLKTDKTSTDNKVNVNGTYRHDLVSIKAGLEKKVGSDYLLTASATSDYEGLYAGVEGKFQTYPIPKKRDEILKEFNFGLRYSTTNLHVTSVFENLENVKIGVAHTISPSLSVAGEFQHNVKPPTKEGDKVKKPTWTFGGNYVIDSDSTVSAKANTEGVVNVAYKLRVNPNISTTLAFETQVNELDKPSKIGVSFDIDA